MKAEEDIVYTDTQPQTCVDERGMMQGGREDAVAMPGDYMTCRQLSVRNHTHAAVQ